MKISRNLKLALAGLAIISIWAIGGRMGMWGTAIGIPSWIVIPLAIVAWGFYRGQRDRKLSVQPIFRGILTLGLYLIGWAIGRRFRRP